MKTLLTTAAILAFSVTNAQQSFTRADSLRGGLRPERTNYDVSYYDLELEVDPEKQFIKGSVQINMTQLVPQSKQRIQLDLFQNLLVKSVYDGSGLALPFEREGNVIWIEREVEVMPGDKFEINVDYEGSPTAAKKAPWDGGFDWKKDEKGNPWIGVAVEGTGASLWWPNKDHLADEPDSMRISITVPNGLVAISNGNLESEEPLDGKTKYNWKVSYPINNYNVSINIGKYVHFSDSYAGSEGPYELDYYVLDYNLEKAKVHFKQVKPMFDCYEKFLGPYPFPKDGFALVETPYLGMEHQSAIAYGNKYRTGYLGSDQSTLGLKFDYIIIHETGHEYWGNSVSMQDIADMWIHEGFCTYSEALYVECMHGADTALKYANGWKFRVSNDGPVIGNYGVNNEGSGDMYYKGALLLHTMRWLVNDDTKWFALLKSIQRDFRSKTTNTEELVAYINEKLGKNYTPIFNQYLRKKLPPRLVYSIDQKGKNLELTIKWDGVDADFELPLVVTKGKGEMEPIMITAQEQVIMLPKVKIEDFSIDETHAYFKLQKPVKK